MTSQSSNPLPASPRFEPVILCALFFFSGLAGLMYEVLWNRLLVLQMGNTAYSLATILTVFMGGLALGSYVGGRFAGRIKNHVLTYGVLEIIIGLYCLAVPFLIDAIQPIMAAVYRSNMGSLWTFSIFQFLIAGAVLIVPVTLMGATLPIVAEYLTRRRSNVSRMVGVAYGVNTIGAFTGCMIAGLAFLPTLGVSTTNLIAVTISLATGVGGIALSRTAKRTHIAQSADTPEAKPQSAALTKPAAIPPAVLLFGFGISGFAAMIYQVAWTRIFSLSIGSATYAFTIIVGAFILGLALGAAVLGRLGDRRGLTLPLLIASQFGIALISAIIIPALGAMPLRVASIVAENHTSFARLQFAEFGAIFVLILAPTFLMGGMLPLVCKQLAASTRGHVGAIVGRAYASNTVGTIAGAFVAGFLLVPAVGMQGAIAYAVALNALVAGAFILFSRWTIQPVRALAALITIAMPTAIAFTIPSWNTAHTTSAPYLTGPKLLEYADQRGVTLNDYLEQFNKPIHYEEGIATTVTVVDQGAKRTLHVGGKTEASAFSPTQSMLAHIPLLMHNAPDDVLIIGLGAGNTLTSALSHSAIQSLDVVEISTAVRDAARKFFNLAPALDNPRTNMIIGDGRLHLALSDKSYDVIISQPSNPWMVGASALFTRDAFIQMRDRLKPGGVVCIWFEGYSVSLANVRTLIATFHDVFPNMQLWDSPARASGDYYLVGYNETPPTLSSIQASMSPPPVRAELRRLNILQPADLTGLFIANADALAPLMEGARISTDDLNLLEAQLPRELIQDVSLDVASGLIDLRQNPADFFVNDLPAGADQFRARADAIFESKPLVLEIVRIAKKNSTDPRLPAMLEKLNRLDPQNPFAIDYRRQLNNRSRR